MKKKLIISAILVVLLVIGGIIGIPLYNLHFQKVDYHGDDLDVYVLSTYNRDSVAQVMAKKGVVDIGTFNSFADELGYTDDKVEAGIYTVRGQMKVKELIYALKNGNQERNDIRVSFYNCRDLEAVAAMVGVMIEPHPNDLLKYLEDPATCVKYGFTPETFPSMFLPDTYDVGEWDMSEEEFTQFMADQYKEFWADEHRKQRLEDLKLSQSEVSTLASILEAEQGLVSEEWPTIAGLYLNRVRDGWKLQSDPTAKFCWGHELDTVQRLLDIHMKKDCPYNTYIYPGLPPGPIRIPSKKAIDAVLNAEEHNYYYMCAAPGGTGLHNFAETYAQHRKNAQLWWDYASQQGL